MDLLEREPILVELQALLRDAADGAGRIAAISGEAGAGKTCLVEHFVAIDGDSVRTLRGLCDPLSTPRTLGPLYDMALQSTGALAAALREGGGRERLFSALLTEVGRPPSPCAVVVEDIHWADDATLDLLRLVARRIRHMSALLLVTYRDDEIGPDHQLHSFLGELPQDVVKWLHVPLLSEAGVREMAQRRGRSAAGMFTLTGGNPFFISEVLASNDTAVPASIREAVMARAARLSKRARDLLDVVSVVPGRVERQLVTSLFDESTALIRECAASGVLTVATGTVGFRHELARLAWQETLELGADVALHGRILRALLDRPDGERDVTRIVHHADRAGDAARVLHFAPAAARAAAIAGAHRQAAAHYATALRHAGALSPAARAELLEAYAYERHLVGGLEDAGRARHEALALRRSLDDRRGEGANLRWLSRLAWLEGRRAHAVESGEKAITVLEPLGPTPELAMAYSNLAQLHMLAENAAGATEWGERAVAMAEQLGDVEALVHALTNVGSAEMYVSLDAGAQRLERAIDFARRHGLHEQAERAAGNMACNYVRLHDYSKAAEALERTIRLSAEYELDRAQAYILGWRARLELERGDWRAAERDAIAVIGRDAALDVTRYQARVVLALLRARRGQDDAGEAVNDLVAFALPTAEPQRIGPAVAARAETAWLRGEPGDAEVELQRALEAVGRSDDPWVRGQLAWWRWRGRDLEAVPDDIALPYRLQLEGNWCAAADAWERIGAPYERALALAEGDTPAAWQEALVTLEGLGAHATIEAVRRDLRKRGARGIPRGPRQATRRHPAGLTAAQVRVLGLLARGLSNSDIARELSLSSRTVDHHVSAILAKLDVTTRAAAIAAAHERQLLRHS